MPKETEPCPFKVGEKVFIKMTYQRYGIAVVKRITKTMVIVNMKSYELRFRYNGHEVGGNRWHRSYLRKLTTERKAMINIQNLTHRATMLRDKLSIPETKEGLELFIKTIAPLTEDK